MWHDIKDLIEYERIHLILILETVFSSGSKVVMLDTVRSEVCQDYVSMNSIYIVIKM